MDPSRCLAHASIAELYEMASGSTPRFGIASAGQDASKKEYFALNPQVTGPVKPGPVYTLRGLAGQSAARRLQPPPRREHLRLPPARHHPSQRTPLHRGQHLRVQRAQLRIRQRLDVVQAKHEVE